MKKYFEEGSVLAYEFGSEYNPRKKQIEVSDYINKALKKNGFEALQAGTGIGKSIAYLMALSVNVSGRKRGIVSVGTKALQDQLTKDLVILRKIFPKLRYATIKGKDNYKCNITEKTNSSSFCGKYEKKIKRLYTELDDSENLEASVIEDIKNNIEALEEACYRCPFKLAIEEAKSSDIVIANNSITFINEKIKYIGEFDLYVFDEAHELVNNLHNYGSKMFKADNIEQLKFLKKIKGEIKLNYLKSLPCFTDKDKNEINNKFKEAVNGNYQYVWVEDNEKIIFKNYNIDWFYESLNEKSVIFISATINKEIFNAFSNNGPIKKIKNFGTVFNFDKQLKIWASPNIKNTDYARDDATFEFAKRLYKRGNGGILVLMTRISSCNEIKERLEKEGIKCFFQSEKNDFISYEGFSVLIGVNTLWTGIDVPGDKLKYVIINKMLFPAITKDEENKSNYIGKRSFYDYTIPMVGDRMLQGIGRAVRRVTDISEVIILDSRILSGWGKNIKKRIEDEYCNLKLFNKI